MVRVRAYPRLHVTLLDLSDATFRKYGGAGFTLSGPFTEVTATASPDAETTILGLDQFDYQGQKDILDAVERLKQFTSVRSSYIVIGKLPPQHIGLGSKTSIILSILKAIQIHGGLDIDQETLQTLSCRGGTSGVGINTFFTGGFVVDSGHDPSISRSFTPSSFKKAAITPPLLCRLPIPSSWSFYLLLPPGKKYYGGEEVEFFRANTPIPKLESLEALALVYHGVASAVATCDLSLLKKSLTELRSVGFKSRECQGQPAIVRNVMEAIDMLPSCAVGMSSMGPLAYVVAERDNTSAAAIQEVAAHYGTELLGVFTGHNGPFDIIL